MEERMPFLAHMDEGKPRMKASGLTLACGLALAMVSGAAPAQTEAPMQIVVLGDSLSAGYQLPEADSMPSRLQKLLTAKGYKVEIVNAGVSGDTASDGLARLDWSVPASARAVIVELGANDALRGTDPKVTRDALEKILARLKQRGQKIMLAGMLAPPNFGPDYAAAFNPIYPELAAKYDAVLYPFIADGIYGQPKLQLSDALHPNAAGTQVMAQKMLPFVEKLIARAK
jgi:acyl-CoA thioesterase-1